MAAPGAVDSPVFTSETGMDVLFGNTGAATQLDESEREKAKMIWDLYQRAKKWKLEQGWEHASHWWDLWRGRQWDRKRPASLTMAVINEVYSACETFVGHIQKDMQSATALARNPDQKAIADTVTKLLNWVDDLNESELSIELPVRSAIVTGTGVRKVWWDYRMDGSRGAPRYVFVDEGTFFVAPWTKRMDEARYMIEASNVPLEYVRSTWERGGLVPGGTWDGTLTPVLGSYGSGTGTRVGDYAAFTTTDGLATQLSRSVSSRKDKDLVTLMDVWIRQDDGTIRRIVCANGIILEDGPSPFDDEAYPYQVYNVISNKDSVYGYSLVEQLEKLQKLLNESVSYAMDQQRYESDTPLVVNVANLNDGKPFSNQPGGVYVDKTGGNGYYLLHKTGANPQWFQLNRDFREMIQKVAGSVDILRGERPAGVTTLGGMEIIREEANVLVAKMSKHIQAARRRESIMAIHRLRQFMKDERTVRISGDRNQTEYVTVNERERMQPDGEWEVKNAIPPDFEADVDFSPVPPGGYEAKFQRALALLQAGVVDPQYVLESIDEDQARIEALAERMVAQQEAEAQQAPAQGPEGAPQEEQPVESQDPEDIKAKVMEILAGV